MGVYLPLPSAYQEVEYIQSSGTQFIDTGYLITPTTEISVDYQLTNNNNQDFIFGIGNDTTSTVGITFCAYVGTVNSVKYFRAGLADGTPSGQTRFSASIQSDTQRHRFVVDNGTYKIYDSNGTLQSNTNSTSTITRDAPHSFGLFCWWRIDTNAWSNLTAAKLYGCKVKENGVLTKNFVPCYRISDSVIGLYDIVNNQFYTNAGTGTFSKGADVTAIPLKNAYIGEYDFAKYQEVEYIQSTATNPGADNSSGQYIDTLYTHNPNTKISIDIQFTTTAKQQRLFGVSTSNSSYSTFAAYINGSTQWARATKDGDGNWQTTSVSADTNRHTFVLQNSNYVIYTNGATTYSGSNGKTMTKGGSHTLPLLCTWGDGGGKYLCHASAKLYGCKIWESGTLVRDFVPCYRKSDDEIGLYDIVNDVFYTNQGTGTFTKGPDVS